MKLHGFVFSRLRAVHLGTSPKGTDHEDLRKSCTIVQEFKATFEGVAKRTQ